MKKALMIGLVASLLAAPAWGDSTEYATQRQSHEDSYRSGMEQQALKDYYQKNPQQAAGEKKRVRKKKGELHKSTFRGQKDGAAWGTK